MNLKQVLNEIDRIISQSPYSKEEIATFWKAQEEEWEPEVLFALAAAYEYVHKQGNQKETEFLRAKYLGALEDVKERYL